MDQIALNCVWFHHNKGSFSLAFDFFVWLPFFSLLFLLWFLFLLLVFLFVLLLLLLLPFFLLICFLLFFIR